MTQLHREHVFQGGSGSSRSSGAVGGTDVEERELPALKAPIFFVGVPRSGTTLLFEAFARHDQLAYLTNYNRRFPAFPTLNLLCRVLDGRRLGVWGSKRQHGRVPLLNALLPRPDEAYPFWERHADGAFSRSYLRGTSMGAGTARRLRAAMAAAVAWQGGGRLATKITGPTRMEFLNHAFPGAYFVHVIRDGRAVVESLLRARFWVAGGGLERPWWTGGPALDLPSRPRAGVSTSAQLAAVQWRTIIEVAREESFSIPAGHYIETRYEDFLRDPHHVVSDLYKRCGLVDSTVAHQYIDDLAFRHELSAKFRESFTRGELEGLSALMQPWLRDLGYE